ncbi:MAG TPA: hypothetical protein VHO06_23950, partial [Polyangia bacterium]|nr:hypothetical protein [Polyangia bacterium]
GAQTMPSGAEPNSPPPATYDPGTPGTAPATTPSTTSTGDTTAPNTNDTAGTPGSTETTTAPATTAPNTTDTATTPPPASSTDDMNAATPPPGTPGPQPQSPGNATSNVTVLPPPPNGQTTESVPVAPLPPMAGAPEGTYPSEMHYPHVGVGLLVGGGFEDFTNNRLRDLTGNGGYWNVRVVAGTRQFVGIEAAYVGDARSISGLGFSSDSRLISNGAEGDLRVNIPIARGASLVEPFGFVGVGWAHYTVTNNNAVLSDVTSSDDVLTVPYGGGLEFAYRGLFLDARFTYRQTFFNNLTQTIGGNLNNWGVGGQIGFEY